MFPGPARLHLVIAALAGLAAGAASPALAQDRISVVASFSILADFAAEIGGDRLDVTALVGPGGDVHTFSATPADARAVAEADILVVNGLGFDGWIDRLIEASGFDGLLVVASEGVTALPDANDHIHLADGGVVHVHDALDPHAWQDVGNAAIYVGNIERAMAMADPGGAAGYAARLEAYRAELAALEAEITETVAGIPLDRRTIVTSHDAFGYFSAAYGIAFLAPQGVNPDAEAAAGDIAALIRQVNEQLIGAVFVETITDPRLIEQIARETGAVVGGTLYSDTLTGPSGPAATYIAMMRHTVRTIAAALSR
jgi:zinc/manganese transport system substrate-binding protein